ncbi:hypothetical protein BH23GEM6_BH23GEM6_04300 [soil metagenome]
MARHSFTIVEVMAVSNRRLRPSRLVLPRSLLVGGALGALCLAGTGLVLFDSQGLLSGATGLIATILTALVAGIWAGAPGSDDEQTSFSGRWISAGTATAVAGGFATFLTLYGTVGGEVATRIVSLLALIAAPVYAIGMLLPTLLVWGEQIERLAEDEEGEAERWGALGGVVIGTLSGAALGAAIAGILLVTWIGVGPLLLAVAVMLFAPVVLPEPELATTTERLLAEVHTPLSHIRVTEVGFPAERQPERRLYLGDEQESGELVRSGAPTLAYIVAAEAWLTGGTPPGSSYLFLGGGAYTLPRRIAERDTAAQISVVELDPELTRVANKFFGLRRDHGIRSIHGDARAFLDVDTHHWDRIYLDVYTGTESLPYPLVTVEAFTAARERLASGGLLGVNLIGVVSGQEGTRVWSVVRTINEVFPSVAVYSHLGPDYPDRQNLLVVAAPAAGAEFPSSVGHFGRWSESEWPRTGAIVYRSIFPPSAQRDSSTQRERVT